MTDKPLAIVTSHETMVEAFRIAKSLRNLSNEFCDDAGEFASGHTDKVLGPSGTKGLGQVSINEYCKMFAVKFVMVRDPEGEACMHGVWQDRQSSNVRRDAHRMSKTLIERAKPHIFREMSQLAAIARKTKIPRHVRVKLARRAAIMRWRKRRLAGKSAGLPTKLKRQ